MPDPVSDSDAALVRDRIGQLHDDECLLTREEAERIAARLEAPIAEDALVEARDLAGHLKAIRDFAVFATDHASALASKADDVLAALHEKKG